MTAYTNAVETNLKHMGTAISEWKACEVTGMSAEGMPEFNIPTGYDIAPTLYTSGGGIDGMACGLCGHKIKKAYFLRNDSRRWTLMVGSECITHFQESSGDEMIKEFERKAARKLLATLDIMYRVLGYANRSLCYKAAKIMGKTDTESTDAAVVRWYRTKKEDAERCAQACAAFVIGRGIPRV